MSEAKTKQQKIAEIRDYLMRAAMDLLCIYAESQGHNPRALIVSRCLDQIVGDRRVDVVHAKLFDDPRSQP